MIPYYNPNLYFSTIIKALFIKNAEQKIEEHFRSYTGKKYVLLTDSCRSALKLAYQCIDKKGHVITSPLTCQVAIHPILDTDNKPIYVDIKKETLVIDEDKIENVISDKTIAIQAIHFGGTPCQMNKINEIADRNNLVLIEDCAQGYGAKCDNTNTGSWGDISCFSMMKNLYGIGGGIFVTDNKEYYEKAKEILKSVNKTNYLLTIYRIILRLIETKRKFNFFEKIYIFFKENIKNTKRKKITVNRMNSFEKKVNMIQLRKSADINQHRIEIANKMLFSLRNNIRIQNYLPKFDVNYSYTKFNLFSDYFDVSLIKKLNEKGIEAKHLEHKYGVLYQSKLTESLELVNYHLIHDNLISLPIIGNEEVIASIIRIIVNDK